MKSSLKIVKALGSSGTGVKHWWQQRLTAIALIPLVIWFVAKISCAACNDREFSDVFVSEVSLIAFFIMLTTMLYHASLGIKVVIEDYVHCECGKIFLITATNLFSWLTGGFLLFTVISNL